MTDTMQKTPRELSIEKGERITAALITYFFVLEVLTFAIKLANGQPMTVVDMARFVLTIVACVFLYKGKNWAKVLLTLGTCLGVLTGVYFVIRAIMNPAVSFASFLLLLVIAGCHTTAAYYLIFSSDLDAYLNSRRA